MGRYGGGQGQEFAQSYQLEYWRQSTGTWHLYTNTSGHQVLDGNVNTYMANKQDLLPTLVASKVRFLPHSHHPRTVCMRVELFGCPYTSPVLSYRVNQGDQFSQRVYLEDIYDGQEEDGVLSGGLGLLSDGHVGPALTFTDQGLVSGNTLLNMVSLETCQQYFILQHQDGWDGPTKSFRWKLVLSSIIFSHFSQCR